MMPKFTNATRFALLILGFVMVALPWVAASNTSLTFGANDLAEWASLHPKTNLSTPKHLTSLLLRLPLACLIVMVAFSGPKFSIQSALWWFTAGMILSLALFVAPPLELLTTARENANYRQQALIFLATIGLGVLGLSGLFFRWRFIGRIIFAVVGLVTSIAGINQASDLLRGFQLPIEFGVGIYGIVSVFLLIVAVEVLTNITKARWSQL